MKKNQLLVFAAAAMFVATSASAQWTTTGAVIHPVVLGNNVSVGINTNPGINFYVEKANAVTLGIRSLNAGATMSMDKGAVAANAAFAYKVGGVTTWNSGMLGSNNFSVRNVALNTFPILINVATDNMALCNAAGNVGIGTLAPTTKLHVIGTGRFEGNLQVTNNSTFGASMNVSGNITATGQVNATTLNVSGLTSLGDTINFGSAENFYDAGTNSIGTNDNFIIQRTLSVGNTIEGDSTFNVTGSASITGNTAIGGAAIITGKATLNKGLQVSNGINVVSGDISSGGDLYTSSGNGVINCGGDSMNSLINIMSDFFTTGTSNLNANGDEDLFIGGDLEVVGKGFQTGGGAWGVRSDRRLKKDIVDYNDGLEQLLKIQPVKFKYNDLFPNHTEKEYVGIIAQDMQKIAPYTVEDIPMGQVIKEDANGKEVIVNPGKNYLSFDPNALWYMTINAIKEQHAIIEKQAEQIAALEAKLNTPSGAENRATNNTSSYRLSQNTPNPFNQSTIISFNSGDAAQAQIVIRNLNGNLIKSLNAAGKTQVVINANELAQGTYTYTLEINGSSIDTKLMVVTK